MLCLWRALKNENWLLKESDSCTGKTTLLIMCKEGWSVELGQEGVAWGGTAWNTLKGGGTEKRGEETKIFKRGDKLGQGGLELP